jgi:hypothetical protein
MASQNKNISITFTALIWLGMFLAAAGAVVAILGIGGAIEFSGKVGGAEVKTTSMGLAILAIGGLLAGGVATRLPKGTEVLEGGDRQPFLDWIAEHAGWLIGLAVVAAALFFISMWYR